MRSISRFHAFGWHLLISCGVAALAAALVFLVWYPGALAPASGVTDIFLLLLAVDVCLGPLITLIVFNPTKKNLKRDLSIVGLIQLAALFYGLHTVFVARPAYVVFSVDSFDLVFANELKDENLAKARHAEFQSVPLTGPRIIAARLEAADMAEFATTYANEGLDAYQLPQYYVPYEQEKSKVLKAAKGLDALKDFNKTEEAKVDGLIEKYAAQKRDVGFLKLKGKVEDEAVIVDRQTGEVLEIVDLRPSL